MPQSQHFPPTSPTRECSICTQERHVDMFHECTLCVHAWCEECSMYIKRACPYCRTPLRNNIFVAIENVVDGLITTEEFTRILFNKKS